MIEQIGGFLMLLGLLVVIGAIYWRIMQDN